MKKLLLVVLLLQSMLYANSTDDILREIKQLRIDMNKRFEQVDKRFESVFNILYILMGLIFASPFIAIYLRDKKEAEDRKNFDTVKGILFTLRGLAQDNEKVAKSLRAASLL